MSLNATESRSCMMAAMETFVVRIFVPSLDNEVPLFCGIVEHVASGQSESFQGCYELVELVRRGLERPTQPSSSTDRGAQPRTGERC